MKKLNFKILSVFLAIAIVVSGAAVVVASPREEVNALSPNYDGSDVYYFCDLYPTLTYENFSNTFSASIFYDVRWISDAKLYKGRKQTVKRAADNKRRYAPGEGSIPPVLLSGVSKGVPPLAHDFACKV